jgi:hypothetical protein
VPGTTLVGQAVTSYLQVVVKRVAAVRSAMQAELCGDKTQI